MRDSGDLQEQEIVSKVEFVGSIGWNGPGTPISPAPWPRQSPPRPGYPMHWQIRHMHLQTHTSDTLKRDSQKLFCDATRDATGAKPGKPQIAAMSRPTQLPQLGHRRLSQKLSLAQLLRCDAMRQAIWCTILTFSTAKLYKGARVAYKFLQVVSNRANIMVTYPNQQNFVASLTSSVNGISRVRIARIHRRSRRIACRIAKKLL